PAAAAKLDFKQAPTAATAGVNISPTIAVNVLDAFDNVVTTDTSKVTLAIDTGPGGATITGTAAVNAVKGVATFTGISLKTAGSYKLKATDGSLTLAPSSTFAISPAAAAKLAFVQQPTAATHGVVISPDITVKVTDAFGNTVTSDTSNITIAIATG